MTVKKTYTILWGLYPQKRYTGSMNAIKWRLAKMNQKVWQDTCLIEEDGKLSKITFHKDFTRDFFVSVAEAYRQVKAQNKKMRNGKKNEKNT